MNNEIIFSREEVLTILKCLARFEGFLMSVRIDGVSEIIKQLDYPVELLSNKLIESKNNG